MIKALVTGAGGFIGCHMERFLKNKGYWVRSVDLHSSPYVQSCSDEFVCADLRRWENCLKVTEDVQEVFSFAAFAGGIIATETMKARAMRDNVLIDTHLIEACRTNNVRNVFFASSDCVYASPSQASERHAMMENKTYPAFPINAYGWEKLFAERMYQSYRADYGLEIRIGRLHNVFGPFSAVGETAGEKLICALCRKVIQTPDGGSIDIWGDGRQVRAFLYIDECIEGIWKLMDSKWQDPLNIGSDRTMTVNELADRIIALSGKKLHKVYDTSKPVGVQRRCSDNSRLKSVLNWTPSGEMERGLEETYRWVEKHMNGSGIR